MRKPTPPLSDLMGNGRYFYVACANGIGLKVIDKTLLTSGNYLGSGSWTVNPVITTLSSRFGKLAYDGLNKRVVITDSTSKRIYFIDADPTSGTFNTVLGHLDLICPIGTGPQTHLCYDYVNNRWIMAGSNSYQLFDKDWKFIHTQAASAAVSRAFMTFYDLVHEEFLLSDATSSCEIVKSVNDNTYNLYPYAYSSYNNEGFYFTTNKYLIKINFNKIEVYDLLTKKYVSTITITNSRRVRPGYDHVNKRLIFGSYTTNSFGFVRLDTLAADGTLVKGSTDTGETGTTEICGTDGVAVASSFSTSASRFLHVIDTLTKSYVGYVDMGVGAFVNTNYSSGQICKNAIEYYES